MDDHPDGLSDRYGVFQHSGFKSASEACAEQHVGRRSAGPQWYYTFRYRNVNGEVKEILLPLGQPVTLQVFIVRRYPLVFDPGDAVKADGARHDQYNGSSPTRPGKYEIICSEPCGTFHSEMHRGTNQKSGLRRHRRVGAAQPRFAHAAPAGDREQRNSRPRMNHLNLAGGDKAGSGGFCREMLRVPRDRPVRSPDRRTRAQGRALRSGASGLGQRRESHAAECREDSSYRI